MICEESKRGDSDICNLRVTSLFHCIVIEWTCSWAVHQCGMQNFETENWNWSPNPIFVRQIFKFHCEKNYGLG